MHALHDLVSESVGLHDPEAGLQAVRELREHLARLEAIHVENALREGWRWSDVAAALGLSKQAAHRKYALTMRARLAAADVPGGGDRRIVVSDEARLAVLLGRQEAEALRRPAVGTEHLLLGLTRTPSTAELLATLGVTSRAARPVAEELGGEAALASALPDPGGRLPLTPVCRAALGGALRDAVALGDERLRPAHLLRGILSDESSGAVQALEHLGVEPAAICERLAPVALAS